MKNKLFGNRLKDVRLAAGMTQAKLGELLGVSQDAISEWENGKTRPGIEKLAAIREIFGVSADYMLGLDRKK